MVTWQPRYACEFVYGRCMEIIDILLVRPPLLKQVLVLQTIGAAVLCHHR